MSDPIRFDTEPTKPIVETASRFVAPASGWYGFSFGSEVMRSAIKYQETIAYGHIVGLTHDQSCETVDTWVTWYQTTPWSVDWNAIRRAMCSRASGDEWRPPVIVDGVNVTEASRMLSEHKTSSPLGPLPMRVEVRRWPLP